MGSYSWRAGILAGAALLIAQCVWQGQAGAANAAVKVPCATGSLISAIDTANGAGTPQTLNLAAGCTYGLTAVAATGSRGPNGLPIITGNITLVGSANTTIQRQTSTLFRLIEVAGTLKVQGIILRDGDAGANTGGGILSAHGTVSVVSSTIRANIADNGAGISNDRGTLTISGSLLRNNTTVPRSGGGGGGIYNDGTVTLTNSTLAFNDANTSGGGIYNELNGTLSVTGTQLMANDAKVQGGAVFNGVSGSAAFTNSTVQFNQAHSTGGGIYNATCKCSITLKTTTITGNDPNNCRPTGSVTGCSG